MFGSRSINNLKIHGSNGTFWAWVRSSYLQKSLAESLFKGVVYLLGSRTIIECPRLGRVTVMTCLGARWKESPAPSLELFVEKVESQNKAQLELIS